MCNEIKKTHLTILRVRGEEDSRDDGIVMVMLKVILRMRMRMMVRMHVIVFLWLVSGLRFLPSCAGWLLASIKLMIGNLMRRTGPVAGTCMLHQFLLSFSSAIPQALLYCEMCGEIIKCLVCLPRK